MKVREVFKLVKGIEERLNRKRVRKMLRNSYEGDLGVSAAFFSYMENEG